MTPAMPLRQVAMPLPAAVSTADRSSVHAVSLRAALLPTALLPTALLPTALLPTALQARTWAWRTPPFGRLRKRSRRCWACSPATSARWATTVRDGGACACAWVVWHAFVCGAAWPVVCSTGGRWGHALALSGGEAVLLHLY